MWLADKLANLITGMGGAKDKGSYTQFRFQPISPAELESAYRSDWLARKLVDIPAFDMTRAWRSWQAEEQQIEDIEAVEKRLGVQRKVALSKQQARLHGGAALYIGTNDTDLSKELVPSRIGKDDLTYLHPMTRWELAAQQLVLDPLSPYFGEPAYYTLNAGTSGSITIHPSRVVRFIGAPITRQIAGVDRWGDSVLQVIYQAVRQASGSLQEVASLFHEAKTDVVSVPGLMNFLATDAGTALVSDRFAKASLIRSAHNVLLLQGGADAEAEKWETRQIEFSGFPPLLQLYLKVAAGAADIPVTRVLNDSPSGMNSTGDADTRNYYDRISANQAVELTPELERLDEMLIRSALGERPKEVHYRWNPLWQLSATEMADVALKKAQATQIYLNGNIVPEEVLAEGVKNQLQEDGVYPGLEAAFDAYEQRVASGEVDPNGVDAPAVIAQSAEALRALLSRPQTQPAPDRPDA